VTDLSELFTLVKVFGASSARMFIAFTLLPVFSRQALPGMTRFGVVLALILVVMPLNLAMAPSPLPNSLGLIAIVLKESVIGLFIGFCAAVPFWILDSVGFFIDNQRGTSLASSIDPMTGSQTSPLGVLLTQTLTVLFFIGGGILIFLELLYESYKLWPVFDFFPGLPEDGVFYALSIIDHVMALTVVLAGPVIIAMFMAEFTLALISRVTPQMNVFSLEMPIKSAVGLVVLVIYIAVLCDQSIQETLATFTRFSDLARLME